MVAYLLCAGFGTRMEPLTHKTPKSLLPVDGRPLLDYLMEELRDWHALNAVHLAANHRDVDAFRDWASSWRSTLDVPIQVHDDGVETPDAQLGAVGDLHFLLEQTGPPSDGALVSGGDSLYRFPLTPLLNEFMGVTPQVLALYEPDVDQRRQSSSLQLDGPRVTGIVDAPSEVETKRICPSWYLLTPSALTTVGPYLDNGGDPDTLGALLHSLAQWQRLDAISLPEQAPLRLHCNTPDDLERARTLLSDAPLHVLDADDVQKCLN